MKGARVIQRNKSAGGAPGLTDLRKCDWSELDQECFLKGQCFKCGKIHRRHQSCVGEVINLNDHIKRQDRTTGVKKVTGKSQQDRGYSLPNPVVTASNDESAEGCRSSPSNKVLN